MKSNLINLYAVQIDSKMKDYKTLSSAEDAYNLAVKKYINGEYVCMIQYTDVIGNVELIKSNLK